MPVHPNSLANLNPPVKPGEILNPNGKRTAGASVKEHWNTLARHNLCERELRVIAEDLSQPWARRIAAQRMLRAMESPDLADFDDELKALRDSGINTKVVKKLKTKTKTYTQNNEPVTETDREVELFDRSGADVDRIVHNTDGAPAQSMKVDGFIPIGVIEFVTPRMRGQIQDVEVTTLPPASEQ